MADGKKFEELVATFEKYGVTLCALAAHENPLHPNAEIAESFDRDFKNAVLLAEKLGVDTVITFSGCPGDHEGAKLPNWVTCACPEDFVEILNWQWEEKVIPYWKKTGAFALERGVSHIAFEMRPGFCVYNPETLLKLSAAVGDVIGANLDPSHLIWQGIDPVAAVRALKGAIYRRDFVSNLRLCGYDRALSIEHEDSVMSIDEGLKKAVSFLQDIIIEEPKPTTISWV